jgi:osmoprotectant transport system permease protein
MGQPPQVSLRNPVLAVCVVLGLAAAWALPFVRVAPNRLLTGEAVFLLDLLQGPALVGVALALAALSWAVLLAQHRFTQGLVATGMAALLALVWLRAAAYASTVAQAESALSRTALGAGFWCLVALAWLACLDAVGRLGLKPLQKFAVLALATLPLITVLVLGRGQDLSIMKEYANRSDVFGAAVLRHLHIVVLSVVPAVLLGLPLAWAMTRTQRLRQVLFPVLNVIQTLPSIAVFGLLMAPLAWLASSYPALARAGISGVGLAPAVLALVLYSLLPIARSALAGLEQVPVAATTAAKAMGMDAWQVFWLVELPLALPVLMVGLRTAVVQTIGLAAVTALIGAGGLGALMFDGLFSAANELVVLGVLPIVLMAVLADAAFKALTALLEKTPA